MLNFLNDPTGEMPWEEEEGTEDVRHINTNKVGIKRPSFVISYVYF